MAASDEFIQLIGSVRPGMGITTIVALSLGNRLLTEVPVDMKQYSISAQTEGILEEITAASYKLNFTFKDKFYHEVQQVVFWVRRRDFDLLFRRV